MFRMQRSVEVQAASRISRSGGDVGARETPRRTRLILTCGLSPGDITVLTAAVRELHQQFPGRYATDVRTSCGAIWEHNPYLTKLEDGDPGVRRIAMHYDGQGGHSSWANIHRSNQQPAHFLHAYCEHLANSLGLPSLHPREFRGDIHLSQEEKSWMSQVEETLGRRTEFWIVNAGGKRDYTAKIWPGEYFQEVIDRTKDRICWVQVGEAGHFHPHLEGTLDLRGRTDLRQLIRLVYHAGGVLCGVTFLMHLAAAVERPPGVHGLRPCVVVAGGREPPHWEAYPGHQFLHTIGALPCCATGGCWRSRALPLRDGSKHDGSLCEYPVDGFPLCMQLVTPDRVVDAVTLYGGRRWDFV
jgi:ADP-heptose:LPS heptosyltransferase